MFQFVLCYYKEIKTKITLNCSGCGKLFEKIRGEYTSKVNSVNRKKFYCSRTCYLESLITSVEVMCKQCNKIHTKILSQVKKSKNNFCSQSCAATYNNTHKTHGIKRSKLEIWIENKLNLLYPELTIIYNGKETINSELDIYIPSLKLAFELNGIFHYEPIFGDDKLEKIQNNDNRKFQACFENGIELCVIDASQLKYMKDSNAQKYLDIVVSIINLKI